MKVYRIVVAACDDETVKKLHVVADLFQARSKNYALRFDPWDGTRADFVVANVDDAYGLKVARIADKRNMAVVMLAKNQNSIPEDLQHNITDGFISDNMPIASIFKQFSGYLEKLAVQKEAVKSTNKNVSCVLFEQVVAATDVLFLSSMQHSVCYHTGRGVCFAKSREALEAMQQSIRQHEAIRITQQRPEGFSAGSSTSAENFFFHAFLNISQLPELKGKAVMLKGWPNIHYRKNPVAITTLSSLVMERVLSVDEFIAQDDDIAKAYLCAVVIAGLVDYHDVEDLDAVEPSAPTKKPTIIKKLSRWLGLAS